MFFGHCIVLGNALGRVSTTILGVFCTLCTFNNRKNNEIFYNIIVVTYQNVSIIFVNIYAKI